MLKSRRYLLALGWMLLSLSSAFASDYLFLNPSYVKLTRQMLDQTEPYAAKTFGSSVEDLAKYRQAVTGLRSQIESIEHARLFKKLKPDHVADIKDKQFAENLNIYKFAIQAIAGKEGKETSDLFPLYPIWIRAETAVVQAGVAQRLDAFETRFGGDSEPVNFLELFLGEALFRGNESRPSPLEPILRLSAVQLTTSGPGLTSSFEAGMNYYFVDKPSPLRWLGVTNHLGLAASLQYLNDPRLMRFKGRPALGLAVHLDRKQVGASWDPDQKTVRMTLGYAFQFIPLLL